MILPSAVKIFLSSSPTNMRKGHHGLSALVRQCFTESLISGHLFVFYNKKRTLIKVLLYDRGGLATYFKRLERGKFILPELSGKKTPVRLSSAQLNVILAGLDPNSLKDQKLWLPVFE